MQSILKTTLLLLVIGNGALAAPDPSKAPPNVIVILSDDQGWGDFSINGNTDLQTPHMDSLAHDGARFMNFYVSPVCSPTRAEFLTGRYHQRTGVRSTSGGGERMNLDETTIADVFKSAGYVTGAFGKWHNGMQYPYHPNGRGFDEFYGFCSGHWGHYFSPMLEHNGKVVQGNGFCVDDFTDQALAFMEKNKDRPFFAYLTYNTPHSPMQVPDEYWDAFKDKSLTLSHPEGDNGNHTRCALAMCENIDWNVGRVLQKLEDLGLSDNTIVVYFCDNGPNGKRWNDGLRGIKGSTDEGGTRSALHIRYPDQIQPGTVVDTISSATDLLPTLTDLAGISLNTEKPLDGRSLVPLIEGNTSPWPDRILVSTWSGRYSARSQNHRLDWKGRLYDINRDRGQTNDIASKYPDIQQRLSQAIGDYQKSIALKSDETSRPFIVGHPGARYTHLPARDAEATGPIQRSSRFQNCSFFTHWTSTEGSIYWDIMVPETGHFNVTVYYTCSEKDVGSTVRLQSNDRELTFKITEGYDPEVVGPEHYRSPLKESSYKDFKALEIGRLELTKGQHRLELKATDMPGSQVMDFRLLVLERRAPAKPPIMRSPQASWP